MAEFIEVMEQKKRMCDTCIDNCDFCPISICNNGSNSYCKAFFTNNLKEAEKIIMNWAAENPIQTNRDKFKEVFGLEFDESICTEVKCKCTGFWDKPYKERGEK